MLQSNGIKVGYVVPNSSGGGAGSSSQAGGCCSWVVAASHTIAQGSPCSILMFAYSWPWMICSFSHHVSIHEETIFSVSCRFNLCNLSVKPIIHDYYLCVFCIQIEISFMVFICSKCIYASLASHVLSLQPYRYDEIWWCLYSNNPRHRSCWTISPWLHYWIL